MLFRSCTLGTQKLVLNYPSKIEVEQEGTTFHKLGIMLTESACPARGAWQSLSAAEDYNLLTTLDNKLG